VLCVECEFESPLTDFTNMEYHERVKEWFRETLPPASHVTHFRAVIPIDLFKEQKDQLERLLKAKDFIEVVTLMTKESQFCINLPATGQEDYEDRMNDVALTLAPKGIATLIMVMPLYGVRRREKDKVGHIMPDINNLIAMGSHCIEESRALTYFLYDNGFRLLSIAGISLGGCVTNMTVANI
jgi:hypothetical protein